MTIPILNSTISATYAIKLVQCTHNIWDKIDSDDQICDKEYRREGVCRVWLHHYIWIAIHEWEDYACETQFCDDYCSSIVSLNVNSLGCSECDEQAHKCLGEGAEVLRVQIMVWYKFWYGTEMYPTV